MSTDGYSLVLIGYTGNCVLYYCWQLLFCKGQLLDVGNIDAFL